MEKYKYCSITETTFGDGKRVLVDVVYQKWVCCKGHVWMITRVSWGCVEVIHLFIRTRPRDRLDVHRCKSRAVPQSMGSVMIPPQFSPCRKGEQRNRNVAVSGGVSVLGEVSVAASVANKLGWSSRG